jgi:hypothetical protein
MGEDGEEELWSEKFLDFTGDEIEIYTDGHTVEICCEDASGDYRDIQLDKDGARRMIAALQRFVDGEGAAS